LSTAEQTVCGIDRNGRTVGLGGMHVQTAEKEQG